MNNAFGGGIQAAKYIEFLNYFPFVIQHQCWTNLLCEYCMLACVSESRLLVYDRNTFKRAGDIAQLVQYLSKTSKGNSLTQAPESHELSVRPWRNKNRMIWSGESCLVMQQAQGQPEQKERTLHYPLVRQPWPKFEHVTLIILFLRWTIIIRFFPTVLRVQCTVV